MPNPEMYNTSPKKLSIFSGIWKVLKTSWKVQFVLGLLIILFSLNCYLIYAGHYNVTSSGSGVLTNSIYLTTTQITTIGYGDVIPTTYVAKLVSSGVHVLIMFLTYGLFEEFGVITLARSKQSERIEENIKQELKPLSNILQLSPELVETINTQARHSIPEVRTFDDALTYDQNRRKAVKGLERAHGSLINSRDRARQKILPTLPVIVDSPPSSPPVSFRETRGL
jgi:hypothetical protein